MQRPAERACLEHGEREQGTPCRKKTTATPPWSRISEALSTRRPAPRSGNSHARLTAAATPTRNLLEAVVKESREPAGHGLRLSARCLLSFPGCSIQE